jgi:hypothetical protein
LIRKRLNVTQDDVLLVSGAMQDKIGPKVLDLWAQVLAAQPDAVLVLYPFAASWQQRFDAGAFGARVAAACKAHDVSQHRVRILPPTSNREIKQILSVADVYLDSFPYSGATTTVEALQCGLPVVAMKGRTQRGHQAAGWLEAFGLSELVATSQTSYVGLVSDLAGDPTRRAQMCKLIAVNREAAMGQHDFSDWFTQTILPQKHKSDTTPSYIFHHMPKTGGTSLKRIFAQWFNVLEDYREPWAYVAPAPKDLHNLEPGTMLSGHFASDTAPLRDRYPQTADPNRWRKISFVRDPLERAISIHGYEKKLRLEYDQTYEPVSLGEHLRNNKGIFLRHFECDESNWREAIDSYWFIGTLERLPESLEYLSAQLDKPMPDIVPHENSTQRDEDVTPEDIAIFRANNAVEYEIYDEIAARLDQLLTQHARD